MLEEFKIIKCKALDNYQLEILFADGLRGVVDLKHLVGRGVFKLWNDYEEFKKVKINKVTKTIEWSGGIDLDPINIRQKIIKQNISNKPQNNKKLFSA